jgi:hypothetical protein
MRLEPTATYLLETDHRHRQDHP